MAITKKVFGVCNPLSFTLMAVFVAFLLLCNCLVHNGLGRIYALVLQSYYYGVIREESSAHFAKNQMNVVVNQKDGAISTIEALLEQEHLFHQERTLKVAMGEEIFVVKRFDEEVGLRHLFTPAKGIRIWNLHQRLGGKKEVCSPCALFYGRKGRYIHSGLVFRDEGTPLNLFDKRIAIHKIKEVEQTLKNGGIYHGDIKRSNMLVTEDGSIKLIDFDGSCIFPKHSIVFHYMHEKDCQLFFKLPSNFSSSNSEGNSNI